MSINMSFKQAERKEDAQERKTAKVTSPGAKGRPLDESAGEAAQSQQDYEREIKEANEELKGINDLRGKEAQGAKLSDDDKETLRNSNEEESRLRNKIAQLRSEAGRKRIALTV